MKKRMVLLLALVLCASLLCVGAAAAENFSVTVGGNAITGTKNDDTYCTEYVITSETSTESSPVKVSVSGSTTNSRIIVKTDAEITLNSVSMLLKDCNGSTIEIADGVCVTLILSGENKLTSYADGPGIQVGDGAKLTIKTSGGDDTGSLTVNGAQMSEYSDGELSGGLEAGFAGIGSDNFSSGHNFTGTINIESGTISANGYGYGAAIGGGDYCSGGTINISGGVVTAWVGTGEPAGWIDQSKANASGIGASQGQNGGTITISGDAVVTAYGGYGCAGIGGAPCNVTISDGAKVTSYGGSLAAGIGGYNQNKGESSITISNSAEVMAYGGKGASGIGQGTNNSAAFTLAIASTANITAYSDGSKAAITGTPDDSSASIINLYLKPASIELTLPKVQIPLKVGDEPLTIEAGYLAVGKNFAQGSYDVTFDASALVMGTLKLSPEEGNSFQIKAGNDTEAYNGTSVMLIQVSSDGAKIQLDPPSGVQINSNNGQALEFDNATGNIIVPAGGSVVKDGAMTVWPAGGVVSKDNELTPNFDSNFGFITNLAETESVTEGQSITLSVEVTAVTDGSSVTYQWYKDGEEIEGATGSSLTISEATEEAAGEYYVVVTKTINDSTTTLESTKCNVVVKEPSVSIPDPTYRPIVEEPEHGEVEVTPERPEVGDTVTIRPKPDDGYIVDEITVTDKDGNEVDITRDPDGSWSYVQPEGAVKISVTFTPGTALPFTDVSTGAWYFDAVSYVYANGLMDGTSDTTFEPDANMTRAMVWAILARVDGETVTGANWTETAREWAMANGVSDGENASGYVTREQLATMLYRYAVYKGYDVSIGEDTNILSYADFADLSEYAIPAMQWACGAGIITGVTDATLVPHGTATRAQCAAMLMRFLEANS